MATLRPCCVLPCWSAPARKPGPDAALASIKAEELLQHIKVLASDEFEGRAPGSVGEARTVDYLKQQFRQLGLRPGNPDGSWVQGVPMRGQKPVPQFSYKMHGKQVA
jgi:hypothetical protein